MDELNEIGDEIMKAKEYLESFANGEKKSVREKTFNHMSNIPLLGNWAKNKVKDVQTQSIKNSTVKEVLEGIFTKFDIKKRRILELTELANNIGNSLKLQEKELQVYIKKLDEIISTTTISTTKLRALDMANQAQYTDKIIKEQIHNKLVFIIDMMEQLYMRMSKTIPALKTQLLNETSISGMINSISDSVKMMNELQQLTNNIAKTSTQKVQSLIIEVTKDLTDGSDVEFYEDSYKRNIEFQETMKQSRVKMIENTVKTYDKLKNIGVDTSNQLANRIKAEREALGLTIERIKNAENV